MIINSIELNEYNRFLSNRVKTFNANLDNSTVIILGTNGSGKSSLVSELLPIASKSSIFNNKNGRKELVIEHNKDIYKLSTIATSNKSVSHSFIKNDKELNINNLLSTQQELIERYFNIKYPIDSLLCNRIRMTDLTLTNRKNFFSKINPNELNYLLTKLKEVSSSKREIQANIKHLNGRKQSLEESLLDNKTLKSYNEQHKQLEEDRTNTSIMYSILSHEIDQLDIEHKDTESIPSLENILHQISILTRELNIDIDEISNIVSNNDNRLTNLDTKYTDTLFNIDTLKVEIDELQDNIKSDDLTKEILELEIDTLTNFVNEYQKDFNSFTKISITDTDVNHIGTKITELDSVLKDLFIKYSYQELNQDILNLRSANSDIKDTVYKLQQQLVTVTEINQETTNELKEYEHLIPPDDCKHLEGDNICILYSTHKDIVDNLTNKKNTTSIKIEELNTNIEQHTIELKEINQKLIDKELYDKVIAEITNLLVKYPQISIIMEYYTTDINKLISTNKLSNIDKYLNNYIDLCKTYDKYIEDQDKLKDLNTRLKSMNNDTSSIKVIKSLLLTKHQEIDKLNQLIAKLDKEINQLRYNNSKVKELQILITEFHQSKDIVTNYFDTLIPTLVKHHYIILQNNFQEKLDVINNKLYSIKNILNEQDSIKVRLQKEVDDVLNQLIPKLDMSIKIEKELTNLNYIYNLTFIKNILKNVNVILNKVFSYPIEISNPILSNSDISDIEEITNMEDVFDFNVKINNDTDIDDIKLCSTAQKNIINLAFNIAICIELNLSNYPLYLDEIDSGLDHTHQKKLFSFLEEIIENKVFSQVFIVSNTYFHDSFLGQVIVLNDSNVVLPEYYNENVTIKKY